MAKIAITMMILLAPFAQAGQGKSSLVRRMVQDAANAHIPVGAASIRLVDLRVSKSMLGKGPVGVHFRRGEDFSGSTLVELEVGGRSKWVQAEFQLLVKTAVARANLPRGHVLRSEDVELRAVPKRTLRGDKPTSPKDILGMIVAQQVSAGQALSMRKLKRPVVVQRGDEVQIVVSSGGVRVSSPGRALASARTGDVISVSRASGKSRGYKLRAKVVGPGLVLVEL